jgi:hypothetical protein
MSDEEVAEARAMVAAGATFAATCRHFGVTMTTLRYQTDPEWVHRRRVDDHERRLAANAARDHAVRKARAAIPDDTRSLTARLMGDPAPNDPRRQA